MAYLGNQPSNNFVSLKRQVITGDGTTSYTLDHSVASVNDVAIFVNNVRQDPASYSISGTALTLGGTISSSDSCYVIFLGQALQTVTPATGTITGAMINYPLTTFSSTGIDDNATANALTIDSSSNLQFNSGFGSVATAYGVRAWVNFNGTGTVAIRASGNVSSITDNGTGDYTVNFTTNMPDANYTFVGTASHASSETVPRIVFYKEDDTRSVSALQIAVKQTGGSSRRDNSFIEVAFFR